MNFSRQIAQIRQPQLKVSFVSAMFMYFRFVEDDESFMKLRACEHTRESGENKAEAASLNIHPSSPSSGERCKV